MMTFHKILFPTDFSAHAEGVFNQAAELASEYEAELHVLNVVTAADSAVDDPMDYLDLDPEDADTWSDAHRLTTEVVPVIHAQIRSTSPAEGIVRYAAAHAAELIVMGTHGRRGIEHLLLGSVAEDVVRRAPCPVCTIRDGTRKLREIERILLPIDFSEQSPIAVEVARDLASRYDAHVDVLHVIEEAVFPTAYGVDPVAIAVPQVIDRSRDSLDGLMRAQGGPIVPFTSHVVIGHPAGEIIDFAGANRSDLIVTATHGLTGLKRLLIGSVAEKVVRMAPCPVLTLRSFRADDGGHEPFGETHV